MCSRCLKRSELFRLVVYTFMKFKRQYFVTISIKMANNFEKCSYPVIMYKIPPVLFMTMAYFEKDQ